MLLSDLKALPIKSGKKTRVSAFTNVIQHCTRIYSQTIMQEKEIKCTLIGKEKIKLYLLVNDYLENTKESIRRLLWLINKFSRVAGYKISFRVQNKLCFYMPAMNNLNNDQENNSI